MLWMRFSAFPEQPEMLALLSAAEDLEEGSAEVGVEGGVDDGIEGAVDITKPGAGTVQPWGHMAGGAVGVEDVNQEEWHPADYECPQDNSQHLCSLPLPKLDQPGLLVC